MSIWPDRSGVNLIFLFDVNFIVTAGERSNCYYKFLCVWALQKGVFDAFENVVNKRLCHMSISNPGMVSGAAVLPFFATRLTGAP
jgi:hypothetical protein